ncbi:hypothetical protein C8J57DRAFT_228212 [Mycena rebaudengoi]|nr:hypothetical protein C8J57DRAFT_228212 [Mycena rebaudengoi]
MRHKVYDVHLCGWLVLEHFFLSFHFVPPPLSAPRRRRRRMLRTGVAAHLPSLHLERAHVRTRQARQIFALQDEYMAKGYRRRSPAPPYPIFRYTLPLTSTSLPLSHDAARGRVSPPARAHPPPSPAARAAPAAATRMRGEVVCSSPCCHAAPPRTTETPSRTSDLAASTENSEDAGCAMRTRWRRPGVSGAR